MKLLISFSLFSNSYDEVLHRITTEDLATTGIHDDLRCAAHNSMKQLHISLLRNGFWKRPIQQCSVKKQVTHLILIRDQQADKMSVVKAEQSILHRLITS